MHISKICDGCGLDKRLEAYPKSPNTEDGLQHVCRSCTNYPRLAPARSRAGTHTLTDIRTDRLSRIARQYGADAVPKYKELVAEAKGACVICGCTDKILHLDHDHITGIMRGILCGPCNRGLGMFSDSPTKLEQAIKCLLSR